jgi:hypothetical protein
MDGSGDLDMGGDMCHNIEDSNSDFEMTNFETEADGDAKMEVIESA